MSRPTDLDRTFATIPLLNDLPRDCRTRVMLEVREWHAPAGAVVFDVGDPCEHVALTSEGAIRVSKPIANGQDILLYRLHPGEPCIMSTASFLGHGRFSVRGVVERDVRGVILPGQLVRQLLVTHTPFREALFATFADRLAGLLTLLEELVTRRLDRRLAALLLERGQLVHATHQELADDLTTAREVVSRLLESFELRGYVRLGRARVEVQDAEALMTLAHAPLPDA